MPTRYVWTLLALAGLAGPAAGGETVFQSGQRQTGLVELFTSEGCSSCPPADRWLSASERDPALWRDFVPIAFHVDYWDSLGWRDRFASAAWTERQRRYAAEGGLSTVYTPGVLLNGQEWRRWGNDARPGPGQEVGTLRAELVGPALAVSFRPLASLNGPVTVHVALLGVGLTTDVKAGENRGEKLSHDFVVLGLGDVALRTDAAGYAATVPLPSSELRPPRRALAVWVTTGKGQAPLQATGGWLPPPSS